LFLFDIITPLNFFIRPTETRKKERKKPQQTVGDSIFSPNYSYYPNFYFGMLYAACNVLAKREKK
jgi:hypothetical protein